MWIPLWSCLLVTHHRAKALDVKCSCMGTSSSEIPIRHALTTHALTTLCQSVCAKQRIMSQNPQALT